MTQSHTTNQAMSNGKNPYLAIFESLPNAVLLLDKSNRIADLNPAALELLQAFGTVGTSPDDGQRVGGTLPWLNEELTAFVASEKTELSFQKQFISDQSVRHLEVRLKRLSDSDGGFDGTVAMFTDLTDQVKAEAERDEQRLMLGALLSTTPDIIIFKDRQYAFRACSEVIAQLLGTTPTELVGKTDFDLWPPEDAHFFWQEEQRVLETGEPVISEHLLETPWGGRWFEAIKMPLRTEQGEVVGLLSAERDITKRKRAEEALAAEKERLAVTLRSIGDGVITTDASGNITLLNQVAEQLTGWTETEAVGRPLTEVFRIVHEKTREPSDNPVDKVLETGEIVSLGNHTVLIGRDGTERIIADSGAPIHGADGQTLGVIMVFRDVTERKQAEEAVQRERDFAESLIETAQAIVLVLDTEGRIVRFNPYMEEISGYRLAEVQGRDWFSTFLSEQDQARIRDVFAQTTQTTQSGAVNAIMTKDGRRLDIEWFSKALKDVDGQLIGVLSVGIDITEQLQAEAERDEQRLMLRAFLDKTPDIIIFKDQNYAFRSCSQVIARLLGKTPDELVGKTDFDLWPLEDARRFWEEEKRVVQGGEDIVSEHLLNTAEGQRWFEAVKRPLLNAEGQIVGLLSTERDITDRKRAEQALRRAHDELEMRVEERTADLAVANVKLQVEIQERKEAEAEIEWQYHQAERARSETTATLDAAGEAMLLISPDRWVLTVNRRFTEYFGLGPSEVLGNRFEDLQPEMERVFVDAAGLNALVMDSVADTEGRFTKVLSQRWPKRRELELYSTPVRTADGEHLGRLYVFRDVTREREVDRMKTEFVSLVSHELRTPLTSIKGYVDLLMGAKVGDLGEDQRKFLGIVKSNADRLVALINDLLDVSRIESGKIELKRAELDLHELIRDVCRTLRPQIEAKNQHLTLDLAKGLPTVWGDADRVTVILTNLLSNAQKYTPVGGGITVVARQEGAKIRVDVRDTGIGLTPEEQAKLFTKFFRADNRMTEEAGGTGLGLVITRSLVEMHGGEITVSSIPGQGSTFSFTLPTAQKIGEREPVSDYGLPGAMPRLGRHVLVVDDEPDIADLIGMYLDRAGYQVLIAHNAADALQIAQTENPDLITLDIVLPDADGFTVLEWLKSDPRTKSIPVVLVSIMPDDGRGHLLGAVDYLTKPVPEKLLLERVGQILAGSSSQLVLVADDDEDTRNLLAGQLIQAGYQVVEAADGEEAVAVAKRDRPGLLLLDIKMPVMDGITALRTLRADKKTRDLPVVMMTASPGLLESSRSVVEVLGVSALLSKPFTAEELAAAIGRGLAGAGSA